MTPTILNENRCIISGEAIIDGTVHLVEDKFVKCNRSLNARAWDITEPFQKCEECFGKQKYKQLTIFDLGA